MGDDANRVAVRARLEGTNEPCGRRTHLGQQRLDGPKHAGDPPERQHRRAQPDDLDVARVGESPDALNRVGDIVATLEPPVERVERRLRGRRQSSGHESGQTNVSAPATRSFV